MITVTDCSTHEIDGAQVRVRIAGDPENPPLVLIHGIGRSLEDWNEQFERLQDRYWLVALDLPGFGLSRRGSEGASLAYFAHTVLHLLNRLGEHRPITLVGNSMGGAVAQEILALHPGRVARLVLVDSAGFGPEVTIALRLLGVPMLGRTILKAPLHRIRRSSEQIIFYNPELANDERLEHARLLASQPDFVRTYLEVGTGLGSVRGVHSPWRTDLLKRVRRFPVPTLLCWGDHDAILPAHQLEEAKRTYPHATSKVFVNCGHMPQIEHPDEFAQTLHEFIAAHPVSEQGSQPH